MLMKAGPTARPAPAIWRLLAPIIAAGGDIILRPSNAFACPSCPTSRAVARIVCGGDMWTHIAVVAAPFTVLALLVTLLHRMDS